LPEHLISTGGLAESQHLVAAGHLVSQVAAHRRGRHRLPATPPLPSALPLGRAGAAHQRYDRTRHNPPSGLLTLSSRPPWAAAQPGGRDEQISWATAERTAPDLACVAAVGYSVIAWIDGKEKVYGSIP